jgi:TolB-like protein
VVGKGYRFAAPVSSNGIASTSAPAAGANPASVPAPARAPAIQCTGSYIARILIASAALLAAAVVGFFLYEHRAAQPPTTIRAIAVLPLKNLSGDSSQEYLADGMTEALISRLSGLHDLRVISRTTAMRYKDTKLSVPDIAKALQVDAVVEGSTMREGERIRVTAQLIRGATDTHFWSETFDRDLPDVLALQSDIAQAIARKIETSVTGTERKRLAEAPHVLPEAYEYYLKGNFKLDQANSRSDIEESIRCFENAIRLDSKFAPVYLALASGHMDLGTVVIGLDPENQRMAAGKAARKALELDPDLSEAHVILADIEQKQWHWAQAEAEYRRALQLNPNDASAHGGLASWLLCQGRIEKALSSALRARELDRSGLYSVAWILFHARRYDDEIRELRSAMAVYPHERQLLWTLGLP